MPFVASQGLASVQSARAVSQVSPCGPAARAQRLPACVARARPERGTSVSTVGMVGQRQPSACCGQPACLGAVAQRGGERTSKPAVQRQVNALTPSWHTPPFEHGSPSHSSTLICRHGAGR